MWNYEWPVEWLSMEEIRKRYPEKKVWIDYGYETREPKMSEQEYGAWIEQLPDNLKFIARLKEDTIAALHEEVSQLKAGKKDLEATAEHYTDLSKTLYKQVAQLEKELGQRIVSEGQLALLLEEMDWKYIALRKERDSANEVINGISSGQVDLRTMEAVITHREQYTVQGT